MSVLIVYDSVEGQTEKVAGFVRDTLEAAGKSVSLVNIATDPAVDFEGVAHIILAAPVHERRYPDSFEVFAAGRRSKLAEIPTLMLAVSLAAAFPEKHSDAEDFQDEFEMRTGFKPGEVEYVAGAVKPSSYGFFEAQILRFVVLRGEPVDPHEEREFTDWDRLKTRVTGFVA